MRHYDLFWHKIMPHVLKKRRVSVTGRYSGQTLGVDVCGWFQEKSSNFKEVVKAMSIYRRNYQPYTAQEMILKRHGLLLKANINPIYVFPGARYPYHPVKLSTRNAVQHILDFQQHAKAVSATRYEPSHEPIDHVERLAQMAHVRRIGIGGVDFQLIQFIAKWMIQQGMTCFQAPYEVAWQLVELELSGVTDGTISPDPLCVALGSRRMLVHTTYGQGLAQCLPYDGETDWVGKEHYKYDLSLYRNYLPELVAMTGASPYLPAPVGKDCHYLMTKRLPQYFTALQTDTLPNFWREQGFIEQNDGDSYVQAFHRVVNVLRHAPVLRRKQPIPTTNDAAAEPDAAAMAAVPLPAGNDTSSSDDSENTGSTAPSLSSTTTAATAETTFPAAAPPPQLELVPLHPLNNPIGSSNTAEPSNWSELLQFDPHATLLPLTPDQYTEVAHFQQTSDYPRFGQHQQPNELNVWCRHLKPMFFKKHDNGNNNMKDSRQLSKAQQQKKAKRQQVSSSSAW
jgi:hypothetical protein